MTHDHVRVIVEGADKAGFELVPARSLGSDHWLLLRTPMYALQLAAGDTIRSPNDNSGEFEVISRGGNVAVQFYLAEGNADSVQETASVALSIAPEIELLGGRLDGQTAGLLVYTVPVTAGFSAIEQIFQSAAKRFPGSQWQYSNIYDSVTGEALNWWS